MNNKKILITGAGGYIGSIGSYLFLENGFQVIALDNFSTGYKQPLNFLKNKYGKEKIRIYNVDLRSKKKIEGVFEKEKNIQAVVHYASLCNVEESIKNPQEYFDNNVIGSLNLLNSMLNNNVKKIIFSSTCAVYDKNNKMPVSEEGLINPISPYGESKLIIENIIKSYAKTLGLNYVILRYFNVCGATVDGLFGDSKNPSTALVQNVTRSALGLAPFYLTYSKCNTKDRSPIRDYIDVIDLNVAHIKAVEYLFANKKSEIINIGSGNYLSVLNVIKVIERLIKVKISKTGGFPRKGELSMVIADIGKAMKVLQWKPKRLLEESVNSSIKWYKNNPNGWK